MTGAQIELGGTTTTYADTGCLAAPSCLQCPFPVCREESDIPRLAFDPDRLAAYREIVDYLQQHGVDAAATKYRRTPRTIYRIQARFLSLSKGCQL